MKTIFRNMFYSLNHSTVAVLLNIGGLIIGFVVFILIMQEVYYEYSFDRFHPESERIYRIEGFSDFYNTYDSYLSKQLKEQDVMLLSPHVIASASKGLFLRDKYAVESHEFQEKVCIEYSVEATYSFLQLFDFKLLKGSIGRVNASSTIIVPESFAKRIFGRIDVVGEVLRQTQRNSPDLYWTIGGVYRDFPSNSSIVQNCI